MSLGNTVLQLFFIIIIIIIIIIWTGTKTDEKLLRANKRDTKVLVHCTLRYLNIGTTERQTHFFFKKKVAQAVVVAEISFILRRWELKIAKQN